MSHSKCLLIAGLMAALTLGCGETNEGGPTSTLQEGLALGVDLASAIQCSSDTIVVPLLEGSECPELAGESGNLHLANGPLETAEAWCAYSEETWRDQTSAGDERYLALPGPVEDCPLSADTVAAGEGFSAVPDTAAVLPSDPACPECTLDGDELDGTLNPVHVGRTIVSSKLIISGSGSQRSVDLDTSFPSRGHSVVKIDPSDVPAVGETASISVLFSDARDPIVNSVKQL